ncbi:reverse transcriptase domain-containing protein [Tanacetum coccineum]|uniref:RNA-directed DNA polymerase n=1 Tax=Tanacetum coccineum TaxID=301880 RepID=A0ABQ4XLS7_9ASTR
MDDTRTMAQLLEAPTAGYEDAIVVPEITADNFELKHGRLTRSNKPQFFGYDKEKDPHAHIRYFNKITSTMKFPNVPSTSVKLMLFPFSLEGAARIWLEKEPPRSIQTWDDLQVQGVSKTDFENYVKANDAKLRNMQNQGQGLQNQMANLTDMLSKFINSNTASSSGTGTLPSNTVTNPKEDLKGITTQNGVAYKGPMIPTTSPKVVERETEVTKDTMPPTNNGSTEDVQPPVVPVESISEPVNAPVSASMPKQKTSIPFPSRRNDERRREKASDQIEKFYEIFRDLSFEISFTDALMIMPKFASTLKALIGNKEKLSEMARTPLKENCLAVILNKLPKKLGDPGRFLIPYFEPNPRVPLILGRSFLKTSRALIDVYEGEITLRVGREAITFNLDQTSRYTANYNHMTANRIDVIDMACEEYSQEVLGFSNVISSGNPTPYYDPIVSNSSPTLTPFGDSDFLLFEEADSFHAVEDDPTSPEVDPTYYDLDGDILILEVILNSDPSPPPPNQGSYLPEFQKDLKICETNNEKSLVNEPPEVELKDLPPHLEYAFLEGNDKLPIIIAKDLKNEEKTALIEIPIDLKDQEKTTFTCPYGTFAYRRMPFGLCNAPGTFQQCIMAIFHDMIEKTMEVFMDDFSVFGDSFSTCLSYLEKMLKRCEDTNLVLNWDKSHFMVKEDIVLGHKISKSGIEVDRAKVDVITKLPHPTTVKGVRSFLGHAGFYRRFIQDFSKIARPMTHLLEKETPFFFSKECIESFNTLKRKLTEAPILIAPDWDLPFELMCDASDFAIGAVLGQRKNKHFQPIHYASKTMTEAQAHYTTTEKELLAVVYPKSPPTSKRNGHRLQALLMEGDIPAMDIPGPPNLSQGLLNVRNGYLRKGRKLSQNGQIQHGMEKHGKDKVKTKPKSPSSRWKDNPTMAQLLEAPTAGYGNPSLCSKLPRHNFELKHGLITRSKQAILWYMPRDPQSLTKSIIQQDHLYMKYPERTVRHRNGTRVNHSDTSLLPTNNGSTEDVPPPVVPIVHHESISEPVNAPVSASRPNQKASIPFPSRRNDERRREKANDQIEKFYEIFRDLSFEISFTDALMLMPKFASTLKTLIGNKEKLSEMARTPLNENCSAVILNKLPKKLGDPGRFLIPCEFSRINKCNALADLGASINLMPYSVWKTLSLPELTPTCMTLELADRSISEPIGIAEDVYVTTSRALIDVYEGEITLRVGREAITFNLDQTSRYTADYNHMTANRIDVIDMACEEYSQEVLGFSNVISSGNPTPYYDPIVSTRNDANFTTEVDPNLLYPEWVESLLSLTKVDWRLPERTLPTSLHGPNAQRRPSRGTNSIVSSMAYRVTFQIPYRPAGPRKDNLESSHSGTFGLRRMPFGLAMHQRRSKEYDGLTSKIMIEKNQWKCFKDGLFILWDSTKKKQAYSTTNSLCSKTMTEAQALYTTTEKELLAVVYDFEKFLSYLVLSESIVYTDHSAIKYLFAKKDAKPRLMRWILLLQEFDVIIRDKKGAENLAADHLSRLENPHQDILENKEITETFPSRKLLLGSVALT